MHKFEKWIETRRTNQRKEGSERGDNIKIYPERKRSFDPYPFETKDIREEAKVITQLQCHYQMPTAHG